MSKILSDARSASPWARGLALLSLASITALPVLAGLAPSWFAVGLIVACTSEHALHRIAPTYVDLMRRIQLGPNAFSMIRQASTLVLLASVTSISISWLAWLAAAIVVTRGLHSLITGLQTYVSSRRQLPVLTRNINLAKLKIPDSVPLRWMASQNRLLLEIDIFLAGGAVVAYATGQAQILLIGIGAAVATQFVRITALTLHARRNRHLKNTKRILKHVNDEVAKNAPRVAMYFTGSSNSVYQVNMWLRTVESLPHNAIVVMRERTLFEQLGPTDLPVVCIPDNIHLMNFPLPNVRVALYPGNAGKNIHMLRIPGISHVFIGHGDSDKPASFNPFSKAYTQIWSAGLAGRDRYQAARIGIRDEDIREVGRPQLGDILSAHDRQMPNQLTVMYAPTWEGWTADLAHSSLLGIGPSLVEQLLKVPGLRLLYRPHPLTGTRDARTLAAHRNIVAQLNTANRNAGLSVGNERPDLIRLNNELTDLIEFSPGIDLAQVSRDSGDNDEPISPKVERLHNQWSYQYWTTVSPEQHHIVTGGRLPTLNDMFNQTDLLVTDVSSVISDFIASEKPYAVCNQADLEPAVFRGQNPSSQAAYLIDRSLDNLDEIIGHVQKIRTDRHYRDPMGAERGRLREYLLGPAQPPSSERFAQAVNDLLSAADARATATPQHLETTPLCC